MNVTFQELQRKLRPVKFSFVYIFGIYMFFFFWRFQWYQVFLNGIRTVRICEINFKEIVESEVQN